MSTMLRQSTAVDIGLGPFVDQSDGFTPETSLTISQADVRLKKNGGAWAQKADTNAATHEENGWYEVALNTTDTNTLGELIVAVNESGALPVWRVFQVVPANVYDSLVGGSDALQVHTNEITAGLITAAAIATGAIDADAIAADAVTEIQSGLATASALADVQSDTNDIQSRLPAALVSGRIDASVGAMASDTLTGTALAASAVTEIQSGLSTLTAAQVNAEVVDALATDTYAEPSSVPAATSSLKDKIGWLFTLARNKRTTTSTTDTLRNDADSSTIATSTISDDGTTFTRSEYS